LRAGDSISRLGLSLGNAGRVSSLIFGDGTGNTGLPKVMDVLEKSLRPVTKSGVSRLFRSNSFYNPSSSPKVFPSSGPKTHFTFWLVKTPVAWFINLVYIQ